MEESIAKQENATVFLVKFVLLVILKEENQLKQRKHKMKILGIGNAIVDVICKVDDNFIKKNNLITHPANSDILKGVTRTSLLKIIKKTKLKLIEKQFTHKQLINADEVFLTSSGSFITPILKIDNKKINNGKIGNITLKLAEMYTEACING